MLEYCCVDFGRPSQPIRLMVWLLILGGNGMERIFIETIRLGINAFYVKVNDLEVINIM